MGPVDELGAHQGLFRAEDPGIDALQLVPAGVVIAIAGGAGKIPRLDPLFGKGVQHLLGVFQGDGVDLPEAGRDALLGPPGQGKKVVVHKRKLLWIRDNNAILAQKAPRRNGEPQGPRSSAPTARKRRSPTAGSEKHLKRYITFETAENGHLKKKFKNFLGVDKVLQIC